MATLYEALLRDGLVMVGYADDTKLLVCSNDITANGRRSESARRTYGGVGKGQGMSFAPEKSEQRHFTHSHQPATPKKNKGFQGKRSNRWKRRVSYAREKATLDTAPQADIGKISHSEIRGGWGG